MSKSHRQCPWRWRTQSLPEQAYRATTAADHPWRPGHQALRPVRRAKPSRTGGPPPCFPTRGPGIAAVVAFGVPCDPETGPHTTSTPYRRSDRHRETGGHPVPGLCWWSCGVAVPIPGSVARLPSPASCFGSRSGTQPHDLTRQDETH